MDGLLPNPEAPVVLRQASIEDAVALADVHIAAWQWAYRGLLPDASLDGLGSERARRQEIWSGVLGREAPGEATMVAELNGAVVGFTSAGPCRDPGEPGATGEVYAIYLVQAAARMGIGRALLKMAEGFLSERHCEKASLWVLRGNERAQRFYEACGWQPDGVTKSGTVWGFDVEEVRYHKLLVTP